MTFAERLKSLRRAAGINQEELAERAGVSLGAVRDYEQGASLPSWVSLVKLARVLGATADTFADCDEVAEAPPPEAPPKQKGEAAPARKPAKRKK